MSIRWAHHTLIICERAFCFFFALFRRFWEQQYPKMYVFLVRYLADVSVFLIIYSPLGHTQEMSTTIVQFLYDNMPSLRLRNMYAYEFKHFPIPFPWRFT